MNKKAIILGTDLPALLAGHAATISGRDVYFVPDSGSAQPAPGGLDFLARPIPLTEATAVPIAVEHKGEAMQFFEKVRGGGLGRPVNMPFDGMDGLIVWNPADVYEQLLQMYGRFFLEGPVDGVDPEFISLLDPEAQLISSVQSTAMCNQAESDAPHSYSWAGTARKSAGESGVGHKILLSGDLDDPWIMQGGTFFGPWKVYPAGKTPPVSADKLVQDYIPLKTNCDCWPGMLRVGRAATWESGYQLHHAFYDTMQLLR